MDSLITRALLPLLLALALVSAAACGDDDDDGGGGAKLTVNTTADVNERNDELSLREALSLATGALQAPDLTDAELDQVDGNPGNDFADTITFDLEEGAVIELSETLPPLTRGNDTIDGEGEVTIDGSAGEFVCLELSSAGNAVYGMRFDGCRTALLVTTAGFQNAIGGAEPGQGNIFVNGVVGVEINGRENFVKGNHMGVEPDSTDPQGNEFEAVWLSRTARDNTIGGPLEGEGNVISANPLFGVAVDGARGTVIQGNYFGLDTSGRIAVGNHTAIKIFTGAFDTLVGGTAEGEANIIAGNRIGVRFTDEITTGNRVIGNIFGKSVGQGEGIPNDEDIYEDIGAGENEVRDNVLG